MASGFVASRLPFGFTLEHPQDAEKQVIIAGIPRESSGRIMVPYGETEVDKDFWESWVAANKNFPAYKNGVIFARGSSKDLGSMAKDFEGKDALTKLEPSEPKAPGIEPVVR